MPVPATLPPTVPSTTSGKLIVTPPLEIEQEKAQPMLPVQIQHMYVESVPSNWDIKTEKDGETIYAKNIITGAEFTGSPKNFKRRLRSED